VNRSFKAHRGFIESDDLHQEAWMWVAGNGDKIDTMLEPLEGEDGPSRKQTGLVQHVIYLALHEVTTKERTRRDGTKAGDYFTYRREMIEDLLPEALDGWPSIQSPMDASRSGRSPKLAHESGDRFAFIADIKAGVASLNEADRRLLFDKYAYGGATGAELAIDYGVTEQAISKRLVSIMKRIMRQLGSDVPYKGRKAISNAQAAAITSSQE
jgi:hypothetical protein